MAVFAAIGAGVLLWRGRRALLAVIVAFVPYAIFHLLFQETVTTRYALPLVPPLAYLAVRGLFALRVVGGLAVAAVLSLLFAFATVPVTADYCAVGRPGGPRACRHPVWSRARAGRGRRHAPSLRAVRGGRRRRAAPSRFRLRRSTSGSKS